MPKILFDSSQNESDIMHKTGTNDAIELNIRLAAVNVIVLDRTSLSQITPEIHKTKKLINHFFIYYT